MEFVTLSDGTDRMHWLRARQQAWTATDVARIVCGGAGAWAAVRREKEALVPRELNTPAIRHGHEREPVIAAFAARRYGLTPSRALVAHPHFPEHAATPDLIGKKNNRIGEIKTTVKDWPTWEDVNPEYHVQVDWQMYVTGAEECVFIFEPHEGFIPLYPEPRVFIVKRSETRILALLEELEKFLNGTADSDDPEAAELDALLIEREELKFAADEAKAAFDAVEARIRERLDPATPRKFEGSVANLTWSVPKTGTRRFDSTAFRERYPAAYERFLKESAPTPRLTITARSK